MVFIKLAYKQIIDASAQGRFEKNVLQASYQEFLLKMQAYNPKGEFKTFTALKAHDGRANSLHYKLSFAVGHFIQALGNKIPGLTDNLGNPLKFEIPQFELIESQINDISSHKVAITYTTGSLTLVNQLAEFMILAEGEVSEQLVTDTFVIKMQPGLAITSYQEYHPEAMFEDSFQQN